MGQKITEHTANRKVVKCLFIRYLWGIYVFVYMVCECRSWYKNVWRDFVLYKLYKHSPEPTVICIPYYNNLRNPFPCLVLWGLHDESLTVGSLCYEVISLFTTSHMAIKFLVRTNNLCNHLFNHKYLPSRLKSYQYSKWETSQCGSFSSWIFLYLCNFISSCWVSQSHFLHEIFSNYYNSHWLLSF